MAGRVTNPCHLCCTDMATPTWRRRQTDT